MQDAGAQTVARKGDHLRLNLEHDVAAKGVSAGFERYRLIHCALPEIDLAEVDPACTFFGRQLRAPFVISCMTGGTQRAGEINRTLARVAQRHAFALGLGSARALIERPELLETFAVRDEAPDVFLMANIGAVQLNRGYGAAECRRLIDMLDADALVLHLNALQEAVQREGDTQFRGLTDKIAALCAQLEVPVIAKEVGWGIDARAARMLIDAGVAAIDIAGAGGTSWSEVERLRARDAHDAGVASEFADWGIPTVDALCDVRAALPNATIIASGGVRTGIDALKALALGADAVGFAAPFLRAADAGEAQADDLAAHLVDVLRVGMFALGARTPASLRSTARIERARDR